MKNKRYLIEFYIDTWYQLHTLYQRESEAIIVAETLSKEHHFPCRVVKRVLTSCKEIMV